MTFKTRRIRKKPPLHFWRGVASVFKFFFGLFSKLSKKQKSYILGFFLIVFATYIVGKATFTAYAWISNFNPKDIIFSIGADLKKDENGYTNILLLGDGGHERDGADLIDTIMVASIDYEKNAVSLLSIPRDYYVKDSVLWPGKINELYRNHKFQMDEEERYELFETVASDISNLQIDYYLRIDFNAFVEVIDSIGGITIDVQKELNDPYYPNETDNGYTLFHVYSGLQEMDGETALKFVRSRKTTSDFDRAARQQQVIEAIREKASSGKVLSNPTAIKKLYSAVQSNIKTNLTMREMIALAGFGKHINRDHLVSKVLHDDPGQDGGFLYTPERKYYNGQFILIPFGDNLELIHRYADQIFNLREAFWNPPAIEVLNATKSPGIARNMAYQLNRFGFNVVNIDNYFDKEGEKKYLDNGVIHYYNWEEDEKQNVSTQDSSTITALERYTGASSIPGKQALEGQTIAISIILGSDYKPFGAE